MNKELVRQYWDTIPCGTSGIVYPEGTREYYEAVLDNKNRLDPFVAEYAEFGRWKGKSVLEVGCGVGSDLIRFAQSGAYVIGIDLSLKSAELAEKRLRVYGCDGVAIEADAEKIPYKDNSFDFVWSWGVLHHTPDIRKAISEIYRVTKPDGRICVMLYHRRSIVALQMWLMFGLLRFRPWRSLDEIIADNHESRGTKAYSVEDAIRMFSVFRELAVDLRVTSYDMRYKRNGYLPYWTSRLIPRCFGWNMLIKGKKPC